MERSRPHIGRAEMWIAILVVLFALAMVGAGIWAGGAQTLAAFESVSAGAICFLLGLSLLNYGLRTARWLSLSRLLHIEIPPFSNALYYVAGFAMTTTPGKMGEVLRLWLMRSRYRLPYDRTAALMVGDRVFDAVAMVLLVLATVFFVTAKLWAMLLAGAGFVALATVLFAGGFLLRGAGLVYKNFPFSPRLAVKIRRLLQYMRRVTCLENFTLPAVISLLGWLAECLAFAYVLRFLGLEVSIPAAIFIFSLSMIMGALSFLPGGLGGFEVTAVALLSAQHVPLASAVAATAIVRLTTLWFAVFLGFLALPLAFSQLRRAMLPA